jgi:hypothetical protein
MAALFAAMTLGLVPLVDSTRFFKSESLGYA